MKNKIAVELENIATEFTEIVVSDTESIINLLKKALDDEILATYQYWAAKHMTRGNGKVDVDPQFEQHAQEEYEHMEILIERIKQLGGFPSVTMNDVIKNVTSHALLGVPSHNPCDLLDITIEAQKQAIETYKNIIAVTKNIDPVSHQIAKKILADEEEHLYDLTVLKEDICSK